MREVDNGLRLDEPIKIIMFLFILFSNLAFFGYWIYKMMTEVRIVLIKKFGKVYTTLFLCGNRHAFERVKAQMEEDEVNEILREDFYSILKNVERLYTENRLVLDDKVLEKIGMLL